MDSVRSGPYGQIFRPVRLDNFGFKLLQLSFTRALHSTALPQTNRSCRRTTLCLDKQELVTIGQKVTTLKELSLLTQFSTLYARRQSPVTACKVLQASCSFSCSLF